MKENLIVGGCFDILHRDHREWLNVIARKASFIRLLLQSDEVISSKKGLDRPLFPYLWRKEDIEAYLTTLSVPFEVLERKRQHTIEDFLTEGFRVVIPRKEYSYLPNHLYIPEIDRHHTSDVYKALLQAKERSTCSVRQVGAVLLSPDGEIIDTSTNGPPEDLLGQCQKYDAYIERYGLDKNAWTKDGFFVECSYKHAEERLLKGKSYPGYYLLTTCAPCLKCAQCILDAGIYRVSYLAPYKRKEGVELLKHHGVLTHLATSNT